MRNQNEHPKSALLGAGHAYDVNDWVSAPQGGYTRGTCDCEIRCSSETIEYVKLAICFMICQNKNVILMNTFFRRKNFDKLIFPNKFFRFFGDSNLLIPNYGS